MMKIFLGTSALATITLLLFVQIVNAQEDPVLVHLQWLAALLDVANQFPGFMDPNVHNYKLFLAAQLASGVGNATARNETSSYLCQIDITFCPGGDNYPLG